MYLTTLWILLTALVIPVPIGTDRRQRFVPWITYTLIGMNVAAYLAVSAYKSLHPDVDVDIRWGLVPSAPHFFGLITGMFIHVSIPHLFWNMVFLWLFGPHVEEALGRVTFMALYLGGGVAAGLLHMAIVLLVTPFGSIAHAPLVGASGAISAILAPYAVRFHRSQIHMLWFPGLLLRSEWAHLELPAVAGLGVWLLQTLAGAIHSAVAPVSGGTAYWAHIGGFVFGLVAAELTNLAQEGRQEYLLEDARSAVERAEEMPGLAVQKYRAYLKGDENNAAVRAELARSLLIQDEGSEDVNRGEAAAEMLTAVRLSYQQGHLDEAVRLYTDALGWKLPLPLSSRERLRLSGAAQELGDPETAISLLQILIEERPDSPEDEIARYRLIRLLWKYRPAEADSILSGFLAKYPESQWTPQLRELQAAGKNSGEQAHPQ